MKKRNLIFIFLLFLMLFLVVSCDSGSNSDNNTNNPIADNDGQEDNSKEKEDSPKDKDDDSKTDNGEDKNKSKIEVNYNDMTKFEEDCNKNYEVMINVTIKFKVEEKKLSALGYNLIPSNSVHLNVIFAEEPTVNVGDSIVLKITHIDVIFGSFIMTGDILGTNVKDADIVLKPITVEKKVQDTFTYSEKFTMSGLEITVPDKFDIVTIESSMSSNYKKDAVRFVFNYKNVSSKSLYLFSLSNKNYDPNGTVENEIYESDVIRIEDVLEKNDTVSRSIYIPYSVDGNYKIEMNDLLFGGNSKITINLPVVRSQGKYNITWKNDDGTVLEVDKNVDYGTNPSFDGLLPKKKLVLLILMNLIVGSPKQML